MKTIYIVVLCTAMIILGTITFASILGENHQIDATVNSYFENIKNFNFVEAGSFFIDKQKNEGTSIDTFSELSFLLELSLLDKYNLMDENNYKVKLKRSHFWLPFSNRDKIGVSVTLEAVEGNGFFSRSDTSQQINYIENLIFVKRDNGRWRIIDVNIESSELKNRYNKYKSILKNNFYVKKPSPRNIQLLNKKINIDEIKPYEKRMLKYIFNDIT